MTTAKRIDWSDVKSAAEKLAGNWREFDSFAWSRGYGLEDAERWMVWYTSSRDAGLLEQSNELAINDRIRLFSEGDAPDLVFERHSHWAVGYVDGFSIRVFKPDGTISPAFEEFCRIKEELDAYPILNESDYSDREYEATLENYREELWRLRDEMPEGWEAEVYSWFSDNGHDEFIENRDDRGGWAPREKLVEALESLGLYPQGADQPIIVKARLYAFVPSIPVSRTRAIEGTTMKITLQRGDFGTYLLVAEDGRDILIQTDLDFPGIASTFGWKPCECGSTDGTVDCAHSKASDIIAEAKAFLDDHIGEEADDPGYFESDDEEYDAELNADRLLAQQELEDFEQADEYFGHFGDEGF